MQAQGHLTSPNRCGYTRRPWEGKRMEHIQPCDMGMRESDGCLALGEFRDEKMGSPLSLPFPTPISRHGPKTAVEGSGAGAWQEVPLPSPQFLSIHSIHPSLACPQIQSFSHALGSWHRADGVFSRKDRLQCLSSQSAISPSGNEPFAYSRESSPANRNLLTAFPFFSVVAWG